MHPTRRLVVSTFHVIRIKLGDKPKSVRGSLSNRLVEAEKVASVLKISSNDPGYPGRQLPRLTGGIHVKPFTLDQGI